MIMRKVIKLRLIKITTFERNCSLFSWAVTSIANMFPFKELLSVNLDKIPTSNLRSEEELRKFSIDEALEGKPIEKALYMLSTGEESQKLSVVNSITDLYKVDPVGCMQKVVPRLQQGLPGSNTEYHLTYCLAVKDLHASKLIPTETFASTFLPTILASLEHKDVQIVYSWGEFLVSIIPSLPVPLLSREVKAVAISKASPSKPAHMRAASCRIIGALCKKLPGPEVDKDLLPVIVPLWRDPSAEVRAAMISQLPIVVRAVGTIRGTNYILGPFIQLVTDELPKVGAVAFGAMVETIPYFSVDHLRESIWPLLKEILNQAFKSDVNLLNVVAEQYGRMVIGLERAIPDSEKDVYVKHYMSILEKVSEKHPRIRGSRISSEHCAFIRRSCAANYKEMARFVYSESNKTLLDMLHPALIELVSDNFSDTRKTIASNLFDIIQIYGKYSYALKKEVIRLLNDSHNDVLNALLPNLAAILVFFTQAGYCQKDQEDPANSDLLKALERCESNCLIGYNWRLYCTYVLQMEAIWFVFTPDIVYNKFVGNFFKRLYTQRVLEVRLTLLRTILVNMKYMPRDFYKVESKNKILELSNSQNFYDRLLYLRTVEIILDIYPVPTFKEFYFLRTLQMADDNVVNIRWALCSLFPKLHAMAKQTDEKAMFEEAVKKVSQDKDKELQDLLKRVKNEVDTKIFSDDSKKMEEDKILKSLNARQLQAFPSSVANILEPTVGGVSVVRRNTFDPFPSTSKGAGRGSPVSPKRKSTSSTSSSASSGSPSGGKPPGRGKPSLK